MRLPSPRGRVSSALCDILTRRPGALSATESRTLVAKARSAAAKADVILDDDFQLGLWILYELHYQGFEEVDADWEWDPDLLRARRELERPFEAELRRRTDEYVDAALGQDGEVATRLFQLADTFEGPSVSRFLQREATAAQAVEFLTHRSVYHLKESDPASWAIPRLGGKPKVALVEVQYDEYGAGRPERLHSSMFGDGLAACGLDRSYGAYLDEVPAYTLALNNAMSLFGLHRRLRAAAMGHLGAFEASSSLPCRRYVGGLRRLNFPEAMVEYFDEHIEADAVHEQLALRDICAELVAQDPTLERDVFFGAAVCLYLDVVAGEEMLGAWRAGVTSLRVPGGAARAEAS